MNNKIVKSSKTPFILPFIAGVFHLLDPTDSYPTLQLIFIVAFTSVYVSFKILENGKEYYDESENRIELIKKSLILAVYYILFSLLILIVYNLIIGFLIYFILTSLLILSSSLFLITITIPFSINNLNYNRSKENPMLFSSQKAVSKSISFIILFSLLLVLPFGFILEPDFGYAENISLHLIVYSVFILLTSIFGYLKLKSDFLSN